MIAGSSVEPLVFVTVGTDHHPFDRLMHWLDAWVDAEEPDVRCLVQHGTSVMPSHGEPRDYLDYDTMRGAIRDAAAIVSHGGPGTIMLAANAGKVPIVVPRLRRFGEHVDDHQLIFARRIASEGTIVLAETEDRFRALLGRALAAPRAGAGVTASRTTDAIRRFEEIVEELMPREDHHLARSGG